MKSTTFTAVLLASVAVAQPHHGHQHQRRHQHEDQLEKRELVVEWETVWETATVYVDETTTETVLPEKTPEAEALPTTSTGGGPGQFFETPTVQPTTLATSTTAASSPPPPPAETTTEEAPPAPTTTSTSTPQPEPTTTTAPAVAVPTIAAPPPVAETTTSTPPAPTTTSAAPPAETSSGSGSGDGGSSGGSGSGVSGEGEITYYAVGLGACGYDDSGADDTENIVAMPIEMWTAVSSATNYGLGMPAHPWCDKTITIRANGKSVQAKIRDNCPGCSGASIDVTPHAFLALFGSLDGGRENVEWSMN